MDQSYGPAYEALGKAANHDAVRRYRSEMDDQSGVYPKPGDPPSFVELFKNSATDAALALMTGGTSPFIKTCCFIPSLEEHKAELKAIAIKKAIAS